MNKEKQKMFEIAEIYVFNAISLCDIVEENLIFSDRNFLTEQILMERMIYGDKGFNKISDYCFALLFFLGKLKTKHILKQNYKEEK